MHTFIIYYSIGHNSIKKKLSPLKHNSTPIESIILLLTMTLCALHDVHAGRVQLKHLKLIKWIDESGEIQRFNLMEKLSLHWRDIGELIGLSFQQLECLASEHHGKHTECCRAVLGSWLEHPPEEYPITWSGLIELLQDSELSQVVSELKYALTKSNIK